MSQVTSFFVIFDLAGTRNSVPDYAQTLPLPPNVGGENWPICDGVCYAAHRIAKGPTRQLEFCANLCYRFPAIYFLTVLAHCRISNLPVYNIVTNTVSKPQAVSRSFMVLNLFSPGFRRLIRIFLSKYRVSSYFFLDFHRAKR
jgi:hypothetical protein